MAGLGRRTFQAGEVLTASNVMAYLQDQAVMNFAGTAARGSAIGTAVSEGMVSYLADSNVVQAYDGSAWNSLAYATAVPSSNTIGLKPINSPTVTYSGTSVSTTAVGAVTATAITSLTLENVFSSTYKFYRIVVNGAGSTSNDLFFRFRRSGADISTGYNGIAWYTALNSTSGYAQVRNNGNSGWISYQGNGNNAIASLDVTPLAGAPLYSVVSGSTQSGSIYSGYYNCTGGATTGFTLYTSTGTWTGSVTVYGYNE